MEKLTHFPTLKSIKVDVVYLLVLFTHCCKIGTMVASDGLDKGSLIWSNVF